jgi:beta-barrel assembly-enhancing protease
MRRTLTLTALAVASALAVAPTPASAQFMDKLGKGAKLAQKANDLVFTEAEEIELGQKVSEEMRKRFGVVQDPAVHKYVTLVGAVLVTNSSRPNLPWTFIVLDTDAVNAFAAPGGFVHVTKGALAMMENEAELAGVLGHELIHVTEKHTIAALKKESTVSLAKEASGKGNMITDAVVGSMQEALFKGFGRKEEDESDAKGLALANKAGYAPGGLAGFLQKLADRQNGKDTKAGLFSSHRDTSERIKKLGDLSAKMTSTATLEARYKKFISYKPVPQADIAAVTAGAAGLAGGSNGGGKKAGDKPEKKEEGKQAEGEQPKKKGGFGALAKFTGVGGGDKAQKENAGAASARGVTDPEVPAKGGDNPKVVVVTVTAADVQAFKKEGKLS